MLKSFLSSYIDSHRSYNAHPLSNLNDIAKVIDLIGPPAVGKSTFIRNIKSHGLIGGKIARVNFSSVEADGHALLLKKEISKENDLKIINKRAKKIHFDALLQLHSSTKKQSFLIDEGISHQFTTSLIGLYNSDFEAFKKVMAHKSIILLNCTPEVVVKRYRLRSIGRGVTWYENKSEEELYFYINKILEARRRLLQLANSISAPTLIVDIESPVEECVLKVKKFMARLGLY